MPERLGRLERPALMGVLVREIINYTSFWRSSTFSATVEPTIYLLAFGFGFGSLVSTVGGFDYVDFVGTGTVATAVLFASVFSAMFGTFVKREFQRTYDAILAAPVDTEELVTAEAQAAAAASGGRRGLGAHAISSPVSRTKTSSRLVTRRSPSRSTSPLACRTETDVPVRRVRQPCACAKPSTSVSRVGDP